MSTLIWREYGVRLRERRTGAVTAMILEQRLESGPPS
jgi:hypothetical protein